MSTIRNNRFLHARSPGILRSDRGGVLPAVIILTMIAAVWIGSFVQLTQTEVRISNSSFHFNSALNLAEGAVERSMLALNTQRRQELTGGSGDPWSGWRAEDGIMKMDEVEVDLGRGLIGVLRAEIDDYNTDEPRILAEGKIALPIQPDVSRRLEVLLELRPPFENGFTFRRSVTLKGQSITFDSYDAEKGLYHPETNRQAGATVASPTLEAEDDLSLGNAKIYGYVALGSGNPKLGPRGNVSGLDAQEGTVDPSRITRDFVAHFPSVYPPNPQYSLGTIDSDWSGNPETGEWTLGNPNATVPTIYEVEAITFNNRTLTIIGPVILYVLGEIDIGGGSGRLEIDENVSAEIFAESDITIGGDGAVNRTADPRNLSIFGTSSMNQAFKLHGGSDWIASIYAPNADIELKGGGSTGTFFGAMVGDSLLVDGNYDLHYDESLAEITAPFSTFRPSRWKELHGADGNSMAAN